MAKFTIETRKDYLGYPFSNTYHLESSSLSAAVTAAGNIMTFEQALMYNGVLMVEAKVSTWPNPSGQDFVKVPRNTACLRNLTNPEPAEMCLFAGLNALLGHAGKKWYRMVLDEAEVSEVSGKAVLLSGAAIRSAFASAAAALDADLTADEVTLLIGAEPETARLSTNLWQVEGIGFRDMDVGWYNRVG